MTLHTQFVTMGAMIVGGMYIGVAQETFRRFSPVWQRSMMITYLFEIIFWLGQTFILYYVLYKMNGGMLRFYFFIAFAFGFTLYIAFLQTIYKKILNGLILMVKKILEILYKLCIAPVLYICQIVFKLFVYMLQFIVKIITNFIHFLVIPTIKFILPTKMYKFISQKVSTCSTMIVKLYNKLFILLRKFRR